MPLVDSSIAFPPLMKSFHLFLLFLLLFFVSLPNESNAQFERVRHAFNNGTKAFNAFLFGGTRTTQSPPKRTFQRQANETTNGQSPPIQSRQNVLVDKTADIDEKNRQNAQIFQTENSIGRPNKWNAPIEQKQFVTSVNLPNARNPPPIGTVSPLNRTPPTYLSQTPSPVVGAAAVDIGRAAGHYYPSSTPTVPMQNGNQNRNSFRVNQQQQTPVGQNQLKGQTTQNQLPISLNQFMEPSVGHLTTNRQPIITSNASIGDQKSMPSVGVQQQPTATGVQELPLAQNQQQQMPSDQPNNSTTPAAQKSARQKVPIEYGDKQPIRPIATANQPNISPPLTSFPNDHQRTAVDNEQSNQNGQERGDPFEENRQGPNEGQTVPEQGGGVSLTSLGLAETGSKKIGAKDINKNQLMNSSREEGQAVPQQRSLPFQPAPTPFGARAKTWHQMLNGAGQRLLEQGRQLLERLERKEKPEGEGKTSQNTRQETNQSTAIDTNGRESMANGTTDEAGRVTPPATQDGAVSPQGTPDEAGRVTPPATQDGAVSPQGTPDEAGRVTPPATQDGAVSPQGTPDEAGRVTPQGTPNEAVTPQGTPDEAGRVTPQGTPNEAVSPQGTPDEKGTVQPIDTTIFQTRTTTTMTVPTTVTQDAKVKKELDNAGAPEVLKLFIPPKPPPVPQEAKKIIEDKCAGGKCLMQKPEFVQQKVMVEKQSEQIEQKLNPGKSPEQVKQEVRVRMTKTQQLKKALLLNAGLEGQVEPADNGVFGHDQLLTEGQANELINELARQRSNRGKRAGNAMFLEPTSTKRWDPNKAIPYMFDQSLAEADKKAVREAVTEIQSKTCLNFTEVHAKPTGSHLYYTKIANPTFCGLSYVGRVEPANPIYLSFMCGHPAGVAIHETMHALGFQHEQLRYDRDQFITIQWENVNPQQLDFFTVSDVTKFSSYGIKYDYGSIMQYSSTIASSSPGKKTMVAKLKPAENDVLLGQRVGMAQSDVEAVKKLYCQSGCDDKIVFCGIWATMNLCDARMWRRAVVHAWIMSNCQKSCNKCGEKLETVDGRPF